MVDLKCKMGYLCRLIENMRDLIISSRLFLCNTKRTWMLLPGSFSFLVRAEKTSMSAGKVCYST